MNTHTIHVHGEPITIALFTTHPSDPTFEKKAVPIAECYRNVFGTDSTWNEGKKCSHCSTPQHTTKFNLNEAPTHCHHCGQALADFWPIENIISDMKRELALPDAVCSYAKHWNGAVIGACWGFSLTAEEMEDHINHDLNPAIHISIAERLKSMYPHAERFAYQDEAFVQPAWQQQGIAKNLFALRHRHFVERGLDTYVIRTKMNPPAKTFLWYHDKWGYEIIGRFSDDEQRVVLAQRFENIAQYV